MSQNKYYLILAAFGLTEPNAGSNAGAFRTTARLGGNESLSLSFMSLCLCLFCLLALSPDFLHRAEARPVERARAVGGQLLPVQGRTVAFVLRKAVIRIKVVEKLH